MNKHLYILQVFRGQSVKAALGNKMCDLALNVFFINKTHKSNFKNIFNCVLFTSMFSF